MMYLIVITNYSQAHQATQVPNYELPVQINRINPFPFIFRTQRRRDTEFLFTNTDSTDLKDFLAYARD